MTIFTIGLWRRTSCLGMRIALFLNSIGNDLESGRYDMFYQSFNNAESSGYLPPSTANNLELFNQALNDARSTSPTLFLALLLNDNGTRHANVPITRLK